jgi:hypothetical protein
MVSVVVVIAAVVLIEFRAIRTGDERVHHAPGYGFVLGGLIVIAIGVAGAAAESSVVALVALAAGLLSVVLGTTRHREAAAH